MKRVPIIQWRVRNVVHVQPDGPGHDSVDLPATEGWPYFSTDYRGNSSFDGNTKPIRACSSRLTSTQ